MQRFRTKTRVFKRIRQVLKALSFSICQKMGETMLVRASLCPNLTDPQWAATSQRRKATQIWISFTWEWQVCGRVSKVLADSEETTSNKIRDLKAWFSIVPTRPVLCSRTVMEQIKWESFSSWAAENKWCLNNMARKIKLTKGRALNI